MISHLELHAVRRTHSYKKADLLALARALTLSEDGTVEILKDCIGEHLTGPEKVQLESNPKNFRLLSQTSTDLSQ